MVSIKGILQVVPAVVITAVLVKFLMSPITLASALSLFAASLLLIVKSLIESAQNNVDEEISEIREAVEELAAAQADVTKQSAETKALLSKANIATAFASKTRN